VSVGLLHTAEVHVATFNQLIDEVGDVGVVRSHRVDEQLLDEALTQGVDSPSVAAKLLLHLQGLATESDRILCTCSTLAGLAETMTERVGCPIVRVDRPVARVAVASARSVAVAFAVESTVGPTTTLLMDEADRAGRSVEVALIDCSSCWPAFVGGDVNAYLVGVASAVEELVGDADVVVLAQASMEPAARLLAHLQQPVLSSPRLAVEALLS